MAKKYKRPPLKQNTPMSPVLTKIMDDLSGKVSPEGKEQYKKVVMAGSKIMFDPKTHQQMELVKNPKSRTNPTETVAKGIAGLMWLMFLQSRKQIGFEPLIMGGLTLMCEAIDFADRGLGIKFDEEMISDTSRLVVENMFAKMGITPEDLSEAIQRGGAEIDEYKATGKAPEVPVYKQALRPQPEQQAAAPQPEAQPQPQPGALG